VGPSSQVSQQIILPNQDSAAANIATTLQLPKDTDIEKTTVSDAFFFQASFSLPCPARMW
jgi:hypothetical protein